MTTEAPNPFEGAADPNSAAEALISRMEQRESPKPPEKTLLKAAPPPAEAEADETEPEDEEPAEEAETPEPEEETEADQEQPRYTVKVNGEEVEVSLDDLQRGYMMHRDYSQKSRAVAEERRAFSEQRQQQEQALQAHMQEVGFLANTLVQQLTQMDQSINYEELRQKDPAAYNAAMIARHEKQQLLQRAYQAYQQTEQQSQSNQQEQYQGYLQEQAQRLPELIPGWIDEKIATAEKSQLAQYLKAEGLSDEEVNGVADARFVALARKAMLYDKLQVDKKAIQKKVTKVVPPVRKGGAENASARDQTIKAQQKKFKRSGNWRDGAEMLAAKLSE